MEQAKGAVTRATAIAETASSEDVSVRGVEYVRMFAQGRRCSCRPSSMHSMEQVSRVGELPESPSPSRTIDYRGLCSQSSARW
jgi:hypothetical protein